MNFSLFSDAPTALYAAKMAHEAAEPGGVEFVVVMSHAVPTPEHKCGDPNCIAGELSIFSTSSLADDNMAQAILKLAAMNEPETAGFTHVYKGTKQ